MTDGHQFPTTRVAAGVLIQGARGNILLVKQSHKSGWDLPGGSVERDEAPKQAAQREPMEVLGLDLQLVPMVVVDWAPHPNEGDKLLFIFDDGVQEQSTDRFVLQPLNSKPLSSPRPACSPIARPIASASVSAKLAGVPPIPTSSTAHPPPSELSSPSAGGRS